MCDGEVNERGGVIGGVAQIRFDFPELQAKYRDDYVELVTHVRSFRSSQIAPPATATINDDPLETCAKILRGLWTV